MLDKLIQKNNIILIVCATVLFAILTLTLIFGDGEDKIKILVLSLILPFVVYGFVRLMYKIVSINAPSKVMSFFFYFFLIVGTIGTIVMTVRFITDFPNGLSPALGACEGLIIATLDKAKKSI